MREWLEKPLATYKQAFGATASEKGLSADVRKPAESLTGTSLPVVWQHYAFGTWNIYRDHHNANVVDWEASEPGLPLMDLIYFVTHWNYTVRGLYTDADQLRGFGHLFCKAERRDEARSAIYQAIGHYMRNLGIDHRFPLP